MNSLSDASPVLRTKLYRPSTPDILVGRPHLLKRLDALCNRALTLVSAAAGYGKTTLVSSWLDQSDIPFAWLSVDERDDDLTTFLTSFITAAQTVFPKAAPETLALLNATTLPPQQVLAECLTNELDQLEPAFVLVLDDFHFVVETAVHDLLTELLRHPPRSLHLVIITRNDPALPMVSLRAKGLVTEIRTRDLRFSADDTADLARQMQSTEFDRTALDNLVEVTEGWVAALRLSFLSLQNGDSPGHLLESLSDRLHGQIADFLMAEVVMCQPPAIQDFLLQTSILEWLNDSLCDAVADLTESSVDSRTCLHWLRNANLLTPTLEGDQKSYRYHQLFRQFLRNQLEDNYSAVKISALHLKASTWFTQNDLLDDAILHTLAAGEPSIAADLMVDHRHELMNNEQFPLLERRLKLLPEEAVESDVNLLLVRAWLLEYKNRHEEIPPLLERAAIMLRDNADLTDQDRTILDGEIAVLQAILYYWMGQGQLSLENAEHAVEVTPIEHEWVRGVALTFRAGAYQLVGQLNRAYEEMHKIVAANGRPNAFTHRAYDALLGIEAMAGNLQGLQRVAQRQVDLTEPRLLYESLGWARYALGMLHYLRNDLDNAIEEFSRVVDLRDRTHAIAVAQGYYGLALSLQVQGKSDQAQEVYQSAVNWAIKVGNAYLLLETESVASRLDILAGRQADVNRWAVPFGDEVPLMLMLQIPQLTLANALLSEKTPQALREVTVLLAQLRQAAESNHNTWRLMEITAMQAILSVEKGNFQEGLATLEPVVVWAESRTYIRLFTDLGPQIVRLLEELKRQGVAPGYLAQVLAAFPASNSQTTTQFVSLDRVERLTNRERQTLELLATDLAVDDIASKMVVSVATVRAHSRRIYSKLHARSRFEAVQRARELDLL